MVTAQAVQYADGIMINQLQLLGMVALSIVLGGLIGFDRELADKPAGLRTHMLVAGSATLLVGLAPVLVTGFAADPALVQSDPVRVMEAVITGVAFLGAGTIIRQKAGVEGLTTAASLLFVAAVGMTVALSQYALALGLTVLNLLVLRGIKFVEQRLTSGETDERSGDQRPRSEDAEPA